MKLYDRVVIKETNMVGTIVDIFGVNSTMQEYIVQTDEFDEGGEKIFYCLDGEIESLG